MEKSDEIYGQKEQQELKASYQQSLANKKEREKKKTKISVQGRPEPFFKPK